MPLYKYRIIEIGKYRERTVDANSEPEASAVLRKQKVSVVKYLGEVSATQSASIRCFFDRGKFNVYVFTDQLATILDSGIMLEQGLEIIESTMSGQSGALVVHDLKRGLQEGKKFSELLKKHKAYFPAVFPILIEAGEETGSLPEVARELQRFMQERKEFRDFVISSSIYPAIILLVTVAMLILLFTFVIPRFAKVFKDLGQDLPFLTQLLLSIGNVMQSIWWFWILLIIGIIAFVKIAARHESVKAWSDRVVLRIPLVGSLVKGVQISLFIHTLAIMVKHDVSILKSVSISSAVFMNSVLAESFRSAPRELKAGHKLSLALGKSPYMPDWGAKMLQISEKSGDVAKMLGKIGENCEKEQRTRFKRLMTAIEPTIILLLAGVVGLVVFAIFQAIMRMNAAV